MREWISAKDIATLGLPRLGSVQGINGRARREGWEGRQIGVNHAWEYRAAALPAPIRKALLARAVGADAEQVPAERPSMPARDPSDLKSWQRQVFEARAVIMAEIDRLALLGSYSAAVDEVVEQARTGRLPAHLVALVALANARGGRAGSRTLSRRTIYRWKERRQNGAAGLAPADIAEAPIPAWASTFMRFWGRPTKPGVAEILDDPSWPQAEPKPSYGQARAFLARLGTITRNRGRMGPRALQALKVYVARDTSELWPGAIFIGDGHTFKRQYAHPVSGQPFRPEVTAILDVYSRRWVGWSTALSESTSSVADALRHSATTATTCAIFYYDNGSGAKNDQWDDATTGLAARLSITKLHSAPWTSQSRGIIERFHSSVLHVIARRGPTYVGERMDDEARREVDKIVAADIKASGRSQILPTWEEFRRELDQEQARYNDRPHSALPKIVDPATGRRRPMTPNEMWARAEADGWQPDRLDDDEARDLFRPEIGRTTANGIVRWLNNTYYHPALEEFGGEEVIVGYDIHDGRRVWVRRADGRFICEAIFEGNKRSYVPISFAQQAEERRLAGQLQRVERRRLKVLERAGVAPLEHQPAAPVDPLVAARREALRSELEAEFEASLAGAPAPAEPAANVVTLNTWESRFRRWLELDRRLKAGEPVGAEERRWHETYGGTAECRSRQLMYEDFGDAILTA